MKVITKKLFSKESLVKWYKEHFPDMDPREVHFSMNDIFSNIDSMVQDKVKSVIIGVEIYEEKEDGE